MLKTLLDSCTTTSITSEVSLEGRQLGNTIESLRNRFCSLVQSVENFFRSRVQVRDISQSMKFIPLTTRWQLGESFSNQASNLLHATSIDEVFFHLSEFWDFLNPGLLNFLVDKFGSQDNRQLMETYSARLKNFRCRVKIGEFLNASHTPATLHILYQYREISAHMSPDWEEKTLEDVEQFKIEICNRAHLPQHFLTTMRVQRSSIAITLYLPSKMEVSVDELKQLFKSNKALKVHQDGRCVMDWTKVWAQFLFT